MRTTHIFFFLSGILLFSSCVSMKQYAGLQNDLEHALQQNESLTQSVKRLETANRELEGSYKGLNARNLELNARVEELLYDLNLQEQKNDGLRIDLQNLNRQLEILKSGSTSEIEMLLDELQAARLDLNHREDRLQEAEKELEERNARLIELQEVLAQKEQAVKDLKEKVLQALTGFTDNGLTVHEKNGKVYVSMDEKLLFKTGKWDVDPTGQKALLDLSRVLADNPDISIMVEGHTDDVPMHGSGEVKDNWDLSVMRATAVTRILTQNGTLDPKRIIAAGRSEYLPLVPEKTPEARQMNRRTEIILTPQLDELLKILESN